MLSRLLALLLILMGGFTRVAAEMVLPVTQYNSVGEARTAWWPVTGTAPVELFTGDDHEPGPGVVFPISFDDEARDVWDLEYEADLSGETTYLLRLYVDDPTPVSHITLYFRAAGGWYSHSIFGLEPGWQTVRLEKADFGTEGDPAGWNSIEGIRFSPWRAAAGDTTVILTEIRTYTPPVHLVFNTAAGDESSRRNYVAIQEAILDDLQIDYTLLRDEDVAEAIAGEGARIVIFPYNSTVPQDEVTAVHDFIARGGKLLAFYQLPNQLREDLGIGPMTYTQRAMSAMSFEPGLLACAPERAGQSSWNFMSCEPASPETRVAARWVDANGEQTDEAALLLSANGAFMTHVLLSSDQANKVRLMASLLAHFDPEIADNITSGALSRIGEVADYGNFEEAQAGIAEEARANHREALAVSHLEHALALRTQAFDAASSGSFCDVYSLAEAAREELREAFYAAQKPREPEVRALWNHNGTGPWPGDWERAAQNLEENGFNAIFPNMLWGGVAHYASNVLPRSETFDTYGDQITQAVEACHRHGIEVHVWKVNWNTGDAPQEFLDQMHAENRTQVDAYGESYDWLCPSHPENRALEVAAMLEAAENYDVDGIHFDYIRYPGRTFCYCAGCRERFEAASGTPVNAWPTECFSGARAAEYNQWRQDQITALVRAVREAVDERAPEVEISAAVFRDYPACTETVAQDWKLWVEEGYLDFVCPMDYTSDNRLYDTMVSGQMELVGGRIPLVPGIGVTATGISLTPDQAIFQAATARKHGAAGFILFNYDANLGMEHLPAMRKGLTAEPAPPTMFLMQ